MKYLDEFRHPDIAVRLIEEIGHTLAGRRLRLMEVCGTHTVAIFRSGIRQLLGGTVDLLSGPGCPVCVTAQRDIDSAIELAAQPGVTLATYGDMVRVPGTSGSLQRARAAGADVRVVYSALDAVALAEHLPNRKVVFLGVGFETTAPTVAVSVLEARRRRLNNFLVFSVHKLVPPALRALLESGDVRVDGLILPGHVSVVLGINPYKFLAEEYGLPAVVSGFEPVDVLAGIRRLAQMVAASAPAVASEYNRAVRADGNPAALEAMWQVFQPGNAYWRGLGDIPGSGLTFRPEFAEFDAGVALPVNVAISREPSGCRCGDVLCGRATPHECAMFATACTPTTPVGPCMVSSEGTCAAYYAYARDLKE